LEKAEERNKRLQVEIAALGKEQNSSVPIASIADFVKYQFETGRIPAPDVVTKKRTPYTVTMDESVIIYASKYMAISVVFKGYGWSESYEFTLQLVPKHDTGDYPDFVYSYKKTAQKKQVRKPAAKIPQPVD
jgi:hypothetical protein